MLIGALPSVEQLRSYADSQFVNCKIVRHTCYVTPLYNS